MPASRRRRTPTHSPQAASSVGQVTEASGAPWAARPEARDLTEPTSAPWAEPAELVALRASVNGAQERVDRATRQLKLAAELEARLEDLLQAPSVSQILPPASPERQAAELEATAVLLRAELRAAENPQRRPRSRPGHGPLHRHRPRSGSCPREPSPGTQRCREEPCRAGEAGYAAGWPPAPGHNSVHGRRRPTTGRARSGGRVVPVPPTRRARQGQEPLLPGKSAPRVPRTTRTRAKDKPEEPLDGPDGGGVDQ